MSRGREQGEECRGGCSAAAAAPRRRRGRCLDDEPPTTTTAASQRCRSCAAVAIADCVALGCCPCAVVSLLGLALVKAPLAVGRRCVGRLRRRRRLLLPHRKRVRDVAASTTTRGREEKGAKAKAVAPGAAAAAGGPTTGPGVEAELAWLEEMYRVGHWGFGRVSSSSSSAGESPVKKS